LTPELEAFFRELRALRASAGLSLADLAERAHFPEETLAAAEAGPAVPPNPVLVAYVQACGGPVGQWEDRWRDAASAAADGPHGEVPAPAAGIPRPAPPRGRPARRAAVTVAATAAVALVAAGTAVALMRPAGHPAASARPRTSPDVSRQAASRPRPLPQHPAPSAMRMSSAAQMSSAAPMSSAPQMSAPRMTSVVRVTGVGCPGSQDDGVTLTANGPGPPWTAAQGGWTGNGCDGASVWTMNPAGKPSPSTLTWSFGALAGLSSCTLSVYVPTQNALGQAGYTVTTGSGGSLGTVTVDQAAAAGRWVILGTFAAASSGYQIQLMPEAAELTAAGPARGQGKSAAKPAQPGHNSAIAASAAATTCSGAPG
jgi:hypothetical protein